MAATASAAELDLLDQLPGLVDHLRAYDYRLSVEDELRLATLGDEIRGRGGTISDVETLEHVVGPLVCRNPNEQERLPAVLHRWYRLPAGGHGPAAAGEVGSKVGPAPEKKRRQGGIWIAAFLIVWMAIVAVVIVPRLQPNGPVETQPKPTASSPVGPAGPRPAAPAGFSALSPKLPVLLPLALAAAIYSRRRRRSAFSRGQAPRDAMSKALRIAIADSVSFPPGAIQGALRDLRRHRRVPSADLDIPRTVAATARQAGFVEFVRGRRFVLPDYLLLTDRASGRDHLGELGDVLASRLQAEQFRALRGEFYGDPRRFVLIGSDGARRPEELRRLCADQPDLRLLLVADVADFWDPVHGRQRDWVAALKAFESVAVLTPLPRDQWGERERGLIEDGFIVVAATSDGVTELAHRFRMDEGERRVGQGLGGMEAVDALVAADPYLWSGSAPPPAARVARMVETLRDALSPGAYLHLCAIAVFPAVDPRLTEQIGKRLTLADGSPAMKEEGYAAMARLSWLRQARIPDWLRKALIESMDAEDAARVRGLWVALLDSYPERAEEGVTFDVVASAPARSAVRRLLRLLRRGSDLEFAERILLSFLAGRRLPDLAVAAPDRLAGGRRMRAPDGVDAAVALAALAAAAGWWFWGEALIAALLRLLARIPLSIAYLGTMALAAAMATTFLIATATRFRFPDFRFVLFDALVRWPLLGVAARWSRMAVPDAAEAERRLDRLFQAYRRRIPDPLDEKRFDRARRYLELAGDARARPVPVAWLMAVSLPVGLLATVLSMEAAGGAAPGEVAPGVVLLILGGTLAVVGMGLWTGRALKRTRVLRAAWAEIRAAANKSETGRWFPGIAPEDDQEKDRMASPAMRRLNRVRRTPDDSGGVLMPVFFDLMFLLPGLGTFASINGPGLPQAASYVGLVTCLLIPLLGYRYAFAGTGSASAYRSIAGQLSYADYRHAHDIRIALADESLALLAGRLRVRYPQIDPPAAGYSDRLSGRYRPPPPPNSTAPRAKAREMPTRQSVALQTVAAAVAAFLPGLPLIFGVEYVVPPRLAEALGIASLLLCSAILGGAVRFERRIGALSRRRAVVSSAIGLGVAATSLVLYFIFLGTHGVTVATAFGTETLLVPLNPSAELRDRILPFDGDYASAYQFAVDRAGLVRLMAAESFSTSAILVVLLLLAQAFASLTLLAGWAALRDSPTPATRARSKAARGSRAKRAEALGLGSRLLPLLIAALSLEYTYRDFVLAPWPLLLPLVFLLAHRFDWRLVRSWVVIAALPLIPAVGFAGASPLEIATPGNPGFYFLLLLLARFAGDSDYRERCLATDSLPWTHAAFIVLVLGSLYLVAVPVPGGLEAKDGYSFGWRFTDLQIALCLLLGYSEVPLRRLAFLLAGGALLAVWAGPLGADTAQLRIQSAGPPLGAAVACGGALLVGRAMRERMMLRMAAWALALLLTLPTILVQRNGWLGSLTMPELLVVVAVGVTWTADRQGRWLFRSLALAGAAAIGAMLLLPTGQLVLVGFEFLMVILHSRTAFLTLPWLAGAWLTGEIVWAKARRSRAYEWA